MADFFVCYEISISVKLKYKRPSQLFIFENEIITMFFFDINFCFDATN